MSPKESKGTELSMERIVEPAVQVGIEEVAAIKVAEIEHTLLTKQEKLRAELKKLEEEHKKLAQSMGSVALASVKDEHPELEKLESILKSFVEEKHYKLHIEFCEERQTVSIEVRAEGYFVPKGPAFKALKKDMADLKEEIGNVENGLLEAKKGLGMLPFIERSAKAAVAKAKLERTTEGLEILKNLDKIGLPGLPAPKK